MLFCVLFIYFPTSWWSGVLHRKYYRASAYNLRQRCENLKSANSVGTFVKEKNATRSFRPLFLTQISTQNRIARGGKPTAKDRRREKGRAVNRAIQGKTPPFES